MQTLDASRAPAALAAVSEGARLQANNLLAADIARYLETVGTPHYRLEVLDGLELRKRAQVFGYLPLERQAELVAIMPVPCLGQLLGAMSADERADLVNHLDALPRGRLLPALARAEREDVLKLCSYDEGTAGALMTSDYSWLPAQLTAAQAIDALRAQAGDAETIYQNYILDENRRLLGTLSLRQLIVAPADQPLAALMVSPVVHAHVDTPAERIARLINDYDLLALPILDAQQRLVGIVTCDDAMDVVVSEATEDFHKGASIAQHIGNLKDATVGLLYRKRVFWLVLLVFGNLFSGAGIAAFEDVIAANIALVFFLPLLVDSGGNAGAQSATLMVRALATGEVVLRDWVRLLGRECLVALALGCTMAVAVSTLGVLRGGWDIALIVASSMLIIVLFGSVIGMSLPFAFNRLRMDPATASGPLITSIADAAGVLVYFGIASAVLNL
ncbi:magnesium transporter [Pseudomonas sp. C2L12B]|uniref:Magnesium transporter MgtE n=2 Tax=Pseudomonas typographi TaxID=2715964 RepID=A0ABR7YZC2_9PSED|nr:magnesium transporter [Pseudomonas typographi]MBD1585349.1 magnesium transporter [Pseudomonas typographi]MBD1598537.1 magnesium transporter [Pseudomonas typographi]